MTKDIAICNESDLALWQTTKTRQWATSTLKELILKGFVFNDKLLIDGEPFGTAYFEDQIERIQEIRISERRPYQKIADIFEQCSFDYDKNSSVTKALYTYVINELDRISEHQVSDLIDYAEQMAEIGQPMNMREWLEKVKTYIPYLKGGEPN